MRSFEFEENQFPFLLMQCKDLIFEENPVLICNYEHLFYQFYFIVFSCDQIDRLQSNFHQWENTSDTGEHLNLSKEVLAACGSIEWQVCFCCTCSEAFHSLANVFLF